MQQVLSLNVEERYLPPHPTKSELAAYYGYSKAISLYTWVITPERVERAGFSMALIRSRHCQRIPKPLADIIYLEENIKSLR